MLHLSREVSVPRSRLEDVTHVFEYLEGRDEVSDIILSDKWIDIFLEGSENYTLHFDIDGSFRWLETFDDGYSIGEEYDMSLLESKIQG